MSIQNSTPDCALDRTTAIGTARFAHEFLSAAIREHASAHSPVDADISSTPALYLMGHGIELALKAFLLGNGMTARELRKMGQNGHDLIEAFNEAISRGLDCQLSDEQGELAALQVLNDRYYAKEFEYITTGATRVPRFSVLSAVAYKLYNTVASSVGYKETLEASRAI
jgi:hypothetical protein